MSKTSLDKGNYRATTGCYNHLIGYFGI